jgi:hypothetical protein
MIRLVVKCAATIRMVFVLPHPGMLPMRRVLPHQIAPNAS